MMVVMQIAMLLSFFAIKNRSGFEFLRDETSYIEMKDIDFKYVFNVAINLTASINGAVIFYFV